MYELYEIGIGLVVAVFLIFFLCLIIFAINTFVHQWIFWVFIALFIILFIGLILLMIYYYYFAPPVISVPIPSVPSVVQGETIVMI
jgi:hypothetical protein